MQEKMKLILPLYHRNSLTFLNFWTRFDTVLIQTTGTIALPNIVLSNLINDITKENFINGDFVWTLILPRVRKIGAHFGY